MSCVVLPIHYFRDIHDVATATANLHDPRMHHGSVPRVVHQPETHRHPTGTVSFGEPPQQIVKLSMSHKATCTKCHMHFIERCS
jgi:hypothetical protein